MPKPCTQCSAEFAVTDEDRALLDKMTPAFNGKGFPIPDPLLCFDCRLGRRLAFYNCRSLYKRTCDYSHKPIISIYTPDKPFTVYEKNIWYSDSWDPMDYGRDFDFSRPFFEQFRELMETVPQLSRGVVGENENSEYTNDNYKLKNCYLVFDGEQGESCSYGNTFGMVRDCMDFLGLMQCELCYECTACSGSYNLKYSRYCSNCSDSWFLRNCGGCKNCFGCANLRQKQYCIFNEQKTKEEYLEFMKSFDSSKHSVIQAMLKKTENFFLPQPVKYLQGEKNIDCVGDSLLNCKNAYMCFEGTHLQDCRYCTGCLMGGKDNCDVHIWGNNMELCYNCCVVGDQSQNVIAGYYITQGVSNVYYSTFCSRNSSDLFGCIGLRQKHHCIFNKQYTKEEYEELAGRIAAHMIETGEWGQFFPPEISAFAYNETKAQEYFPLSKEEVLKRGWQWSDFEPVVEAEKSIPSSQLPDDSERIPDDVLNWAITCEKTGKLYKLNAKELAFYREHRLPIPRRHPDQRHNDRMALKNPFVVYDRDCLKCNKSVQTTHSPEMDKPVYCEKCYQEDVY
tara:strand:- start:1225 stop:2916 length:1692 start_codon:yes stop_codon:yes gene_type:complete